MRNINKLGDTELNTWKDQNQNQPISQYFVTFPVCLWHTA